MDWINAVEQMCTLVLVGILAVGVLGFFWEVKADIAQSGWFSILRCLFVRMTNRSG